MADPVTLGGDFGLNPKSPPGSGSGRSTPSSARSRIGQAAPGGRHGPGPCHRQPPDFLKTVRFSENSQFRVSPSPLDVEKVIRLCARMWFIEVGTCVGMARRRRARLHSLPGIPGEVTFTPMDYSSEDPQTLAASGSCFDAGSPTAASLAPCRLPAEESTLVTFEAGESDSKVTFNPGSLIPGQTYEVSVDEGAFVGKSAGDAGTPRASAAFSTRFYQAQTVQACVVGDASGGPLHRSSAIKVTFNGPVHVDDSKAISIGPYATTTHHKPFREVQSNMGSCPTPPKDEGNNVG